MATLGDTNVESDTNTLDTTIQACGPFVAGSSGSLGTGHAELAFTGSATVMMRMEVYSDNAGAPDVLVGHSDTVTHAAVTGASLIAFPNFTGSVVAGLSYHVAIKVDAGGGGAGLAIAVNKTGVTTSLNYVSGHAWGGGSDPDPYPTPSGTLAWVYTLNVDYTPPATFVARIINYG